MNGRLQKLIVIETTPKQLREIADRLERKWEKCRLGEDVPKEEYYLSDNTELRFVIDQTVKYDEEKRERYHKLKLDWDLACGKDTLIK